jgi:hypothetical protein
MASLEQIQQAFNDLNARYAKTLRALDQALDQLESAQTSVIASDVPQDELREAARLMSISDLNKEDLSAQDIYDMMMKTSEEEVRSKVGFWAVPLPKADDPKPTPNRKYTTK